MPEAIRVSAQFAVQQQVGPIPSPEILKNYDAVKAGFADRIIKMAEEESAHRRDLEKLAVESQAKDQAAYRRAEMLGQISGLAIGLAAIGGAVYSAVHGAQIAGSILGTTGVSGLVTAFIMGRQNLLKLRQQELELQRAGRQQAEESQPQQYPS